MRIGTVFIESGGDNLAAAFSPELVDVAIYVMTAGATRFRARADRIMRWTCW